MKKSKLMSLKIPTGYAVCYNNFKDINPLIKGETIDNWENFTEDILQIIKMELKGGTWHIPDDYLLIDLGWYPDSDINGQYFLKLIEVKSNNGKKNWEDLKFFKSKDRYEIKEKLEKWLIL